MNDYDILLKKAIKLNDDLCDVRYILHWAATFMIAMFVFCIYQQIRIVLLEQEKRKMASGSDEDQMGQKGKN